MRMGALGIRTMVSGRLNGAEIARTESTTPEGRVPLQTLRADVEYGFGEARTAYGNIGCKVWIYKGEILPPPKRRPQAADVASEDENEGHPEAEGTDGIDALAEGLSNSAQVQTEEAGEESRNADS